MFLSLTCTIICEIMAAAARRRRPNYSLEQAVDLIAGDSEDDQSGSDVDIGDFVHDHPDSDSDDDGPTSSETSSGEWRTVTNRFRLSTVHEFISESGPVWTPDNDSQPIEYFDRFFLPTSSGGESLWEYLLAETNKYAEYQIRKAGVLQRHSKMRHWKPIDMQALRAFVGILLNMGLLKKHSIESYWDSAHYSQDTPCFRRVFTLRTFLLILRFFHASDSELEDQTRDQRGRSSDPTYKFKFVLDHLNQRWSDEYNLSRDISIDETIVGFKGRHTLVNYIRIKKHHQWGPKEYNLADSKTGYVHQTLYHTRGMRTSDHGQPYDVCEKLLRPHGGKYHRLFVDNYYMSIPLCHQMLEKDIYVTGTVRSNRRGLPEDIKSARRLRGSMVAKTNGEILAMSWVDRKQVRMLTTHSSAALVSVRRAGGQDTRVPQMVVDYNKGMGGVDVADQMTDHYASELRTVKCWRKIVFHLFDRTVTNAYICYKNNPHNQERKLTHQKFLVSVIEGLINGYQEPRVRGRRPSVGPHESRLTERHFIENIPDDKRRKCAVCSNNASAYKGTRIRTWCPDCGVALCLSNCFKLYHTQINL